MAVHHMDAVVVMEVLVIEGVGGDLDFKGEEEAHILNQDEGNMAATDQIVMA